MLYIFSTMLNVSAFSQVIENKQNDFLIYWEIWPFRPNVQMFFFEVLNHILERGTLYVITGHPACIAYIHPNFQTIVIVWGDNDLVSDWGAKNSLNFSLLLSRTRQLLMGFKPIKLTI